MGTWRLHVVFIVIAIVLQSCEVFSQRATKSSLTFVIDDSQSMTDEIEQVRDSVDSIFEAVINSNQSHIKNFVLVSFNDGTKDEPDYILHAVTEDHATFKAAAARVHVRDGIGECPEKAMLGIKIGIENSLPMSTLYVFTDASAKDYYLYDDIRAMAQRKQIQVTFLLTDDCFGRDDKRYKVYEKLATDTNGEVFNMKKKDLKDILNYVRENTKSRGEFIASKSFPAGYGFQFNFTVDSRTKDFTLSLAGREPKLEIIDPHGNVAITEPVVKKPEILIVKVKNTAPGMYKAKVGSETGTLAKVTGQSDIHFEYGFSKLEPTSLSVTATRPEADGKTYLSIRLYGDRVKLKTAKILDLKDTVLNELPLQLLDAATNFYTTKQFEPPKTTFRVFVYGYDEDNKMDLNRSGGTPTVSRDPNEKVEDVEPEVTIIEGNKVILDYDSTLHVQCKVHAHPKPEITWRDKDTGVIIPANITEVAPPYDFISVLNIEKSNKNGTYECTANNSLGTKDSYVVVEANIYFKVLEPPKNTTSIEYDKEGSISCVVNASPPATTIWYKDGVSLSNDTNVVIASDNTTLTIKHMDLGSVGTYVCEVRNQLQREVFHSEVDVFGLEKPVIDKTEDEINILKGEDVGLVCQISQGVPKPTIQWYYQSQAGDSVQTLAETSDRLQLNSVTVDSNGKYTCNATNLVGSDTFTMELIVEYPPTIKMDGTNKTQPEQGDAVTLPCDVDGVPSPIVKWFKNDTQFDGSVDITITSSYSLKFNAITVSDSGLYTCMAESQYGSVNKTISVDVTAKPIIDKSNKTILVIKGADSQLACRVTQGTPEPTIQWSYQSQAGDSVQTLVKTSNTLQLKSVTVDKNGKYTCNATNMAGSDTFTMELIVEYPPTIKMDGTNKTQPEQGDAVTLPCDVDGVPPPIVKWFKNETQFDSTVDITITSSYSLKFNAITVSDSGLYTCMAESQYGSVNKTISVDVTAKPIIGKSNKTILVIKGVDAQLACRVTQGTPEPTIQWSYQSQAGDSVLTLAETSDTLQLKSVTVDSNGKYTCNATNQAGSDTFTIELLVEYAPTIDIDGSNKLQPIQGNAVTILCDVDGAPPPIVKWLKNGTPLDSTVDIEITNNDSLKFRAIALSDSGLYTCLAENRYGSVNKTVSIDVTVGPQIEPVTVINITKVLNQRLELNCLVNGHPRPDIHWIHTDFHGVTMSAKILSRDHGQYLFTENVRLTDEGFYTCVASNIGGSTNITYEVKVNAVPVIDKTDYEKRVLKGEDVQLPCRVIQGNPKPTIQWSFQSKDSKYLLNLDATGEELYLPSVTADQSGTYQCNASNVEGFDLQIIEFIVEYPPTIRDDGNNTIIAVQNNIITIPCEVDGIPSPSVKWFKNGDQLSSKRKTAIMDNHSLRIIAESVSSIEKYTCVAENIHGSKNKTVSVNVYVEPSIEVPLNTTIEINVGEYLILPCRADGYPIPSITWIYYNVAGIKEDKLLKYHKNSMVMELENVRVKDSGSYICQARNEAGPSNLMYSVTVNAPPVIVDNPEKTMKAVKGDLVLRLPCEVTGSPKPTITWIKNDFNVALGSAKYDIDNGTLIIMNTDMLSGGNYVCVAENKAGKANVSYDVIVTDYPERDTPVLKKFIENGQKVNIECDIPHNGLDLLRWYKDGNLLIEGELTLNNAQQSDNGVYSCRVSNSTKSSSAHVDITVGYKPYFTSDQKLYHNFVKDDFVGLICSAKGFPTPKVYWWLNGEELMETSMSYELLMRLDNRGNYTCEISNELGSIQRTFTVAAQGCIIDARKDFLNKTQPIMLSPSLTWPMFDVSEGYMFLNKDDIFKLHCPTGFDIDNDSKFIEAQCINETNVKVNGKIYKYAEVKCKTEMEPTAQIFRGGCMAGYNTSYIQVGYDVDGRFFKVYDVCLDNEDEVPLYTQHSINRAQYNVTKDVGKWFGHVMLPLDFDTMYDCVTQVEDISATLGKPFHQYDKCCYDKRQLVNSKDLRPGIPPGVAYSYLNVVPHWSTCNSKNWADVEQRVRDLAMSRDNELIISTGITKQRRNTSDTMLHDKRGRTQPIAQYLWKVVQDPVSKSSLAIIQINVPDISRAKARKLVRCRNICNNVGWLDSSNWHNVKDGYTYCCSVLEFESVFNYNGQFSGDMTNILSDWRNSDYDYS